MRNVFRPWHINLIEDCQSDWAKSRGNISNMKTETAFQDHDPQINLHSSIEDLVFICQLEYKQLYDGIF